MRFAILGNSGSGKTFMANWVGQTAGLPVLDLDTIAWEPDQPGVARSHDLATADVVRFCSAPGGWVLEGCYEHLIGASFPFRPLLVFLNPGLETCINNCHSRPWEPHKYPSKQSQDENLAFLLSWVGEYYTRSGPMSLEAHRQTYAAYPGPKVELVRM